MPCSPSSLAIDLALWINPKMSEVFLLSYQNLSEGDTYDCALTSVPCESNITKMISSDPAVLFWFDVIVFYILLAAIVVMGIVGNIINIIIFSKYSIATDSTNNLLLGLSVSDLLGSLIIVMSVISAYLCFLDEATALTVYNILEPRVFSMSRWLSLLSLDIVTVISLQRAVAVVLPFKISTIFSHRNTNIIIGCLVVICLCSMVPLQAAFYPRWSFHPYFDKQISIGYVFLIDFTFFMSYVTMYFNSRSVVDLVLILLAGSLTVFKLKMHAKNRASLKADAPNSDTNVSKTSVGEAKVIKLSLAVCFLTFVVYSLFILINGALLVLAETLFNSYITFVGGFLIMTLQSVSSCFNFFVYLGMSDKYRGIITSCFRDNEAQK